MKDSEVINAILDEVTNQDDTILYHVDGPAYNDQGGSDGFENWGNNG